jgi:hypothetical protein
MNSAIGLHVACQAATSKVADRPYSGGKVVGGGCARRKRVFFGVWCARTGRRGWDGLDGARLRRAGEAMTIT